MWFDTTTVKRIIQSPSTNQVARLFAVNLVSIPLGIIVSIFLTRLLGVEDYGNYQFINSIFTFAITFLTFGFLQATSRALVLNYSPVRAKQYYGTTLIILGGIFVLMSVALLLYGLLDENLQSKNIQSIFLLAIPVSSIFLLMSYFETLLQADNQIKLLSQSRLMPKILFGIVVTVIYFYFKDTEYEKLKLVFLIFFITQLIAYLYLIQKLKVSFSFFRSRLKEIWIYNKKFGFDVYLGSLFALGFSSLIQILIGYFSADNSGVGYFALALTFSMPLSIIPNIIATTHYKNFAQSNSVSAKLLFITIGLSILGLFTVWILVPPMVNHFYGKEYRPVIQINLIVSVAVLIHGFGDFFNRFLGANGQGKALRNSAFYVGGSLMVGSVLLIPKFGEYGAAYAKLLAGVVYLSVIIYYYLKFIRAKKKK